MILTTTLNRLKAAHACDDRYEHLLTCLGGPSFDGDAPINLLAILEHNGVADCLWALRATEQNCDVVARLMACDYAEAVLPSVEEKYPNDGRPRAAIEAARKFVRGEITVDEMHASSAACAAWAAGAASCASGAAWAAACAFCASGAAWAAMAGGAAQAVIIRKYLEQGEA
jgi:hypothetical protein